MTIPCGQCGQVNFDLAQRCVGCGRTLTPAAPPPQSAPTRRRRPPGTHTSMLHSGLLGSKIVAIEDDDTVLSSTGHSRRARTVVNALKVIEKDDKLILCSMRVLNRISAVIFGLAALFIAWLFFSKLKHELTELYLYGPAYASYYIYHGVNPYRYWFGVAISGIPVAFMFLFSLAFLVVDSGRVECYRASGKICVYRSNTREPWRTWLLEQIDGFSVQEHLHSMPQKFGNPGDDMAMFHVLTLTLVNGRSFPLGSSPDRLLVDAVCNELSDIVDKARTRYGKQAIDAIKQKAQTWPASQGDTHE